MHSHMLTHNNCLIPKRLDKFEKDGWKGKNGGKFELAVIQMHANNSDRARPTGRGTEQNS